MNLEAGTRARAVAIHASGKDAAMFFRGMAFATIGSVVPWALLIWYLL